MLYRTDKIKNEILLSKIDSIGYFMQLSPTGQSVVLTPGGYTVGKTSYAYVVRLDNKQVYRLEDSNGGGFGEIKWSSDGAWLSYSTFDQTTVTETMHVMNENGQEVWTIALPFQVEASNWMCN